MSVEHCPLDFDRSGFHFLGRVEIDLLWILGVFSWRSEMPPRFQEPTS